MNNLNYPLRVSKSKFPSVFFEKINDEQKINEENIENNLVFCIDPRKAFAIKSIPRSGFRNPSHKNKIRLFLFWLNFDFGFFINHDETNCVSEQLRRKDRI